MLNKSSIKIVSVCSAIIGAIAAVPAMIPLVRGVAFLALMFFVAPFIIVYLKRLEIIKFDTPEKYLTVGAIAGATSFIGFAIVYFPITLLLNLIFKIQAFIWVKVVFTNFVFLVAMLILIALLNALFNAFAAFITANIYQYIENRR